MRCKMNHATSTSSALGAALGGGTKLRFIDGENPWLSVGYPTPNLGMSLR
jgi:hypothetical protein